MPGCKLNDGRKLGAGYKPYIVAEVNSSHNGNMETAKEMVRKAKEIGCDCVKFQSWSAESLYSKTYYMENPIAHRIVKKVAFSKEEQLDIANYCKDVGISFASTPYSEDEVDFLAEKCNVPFIKVASMDINHYPFLKYIAQKNMPIVLATGMADMDEIRNAVYTIEEYGNQNICLLHCVSLYPPETRAIRLKNIVGLQKEFPNLVVGFSDHSIGTEMAAAAVALGAVLVEKHFTLDKSKIGMDNQMATEPEEFSALIRQCQNVYAALGTEERVLQKEELEQRIKMRRSIIIKHDMKKGDVLKEEDLGAKRPGYGFEPGRWKDLVGRKLAYDKVGDTLVKKEELL